MMEKTLTVQIGNSDDKLSQKDWRDFVDQVGIRIKSYANQVFFFGAPPNYAQWQNACWVFSMDVSKIEAFRIAFRNIKFVFNQESIALTIGETEFI